MYIIFNVLTFQESVFIM